jgi:hypothetical protein
MFIMSNVVVSQNLIKFLHVQPIVRCWGSTGITFRTTLVLFFVIKLLFPAPIHFLIFAWLEHLYYPSAPEWCVIKPPATNPPLLEQILLPAAYYRAITRPASTLFKSPP